MSEFVSSRRLVRDSVDRLQPYHPVEDPTRLASRLGMSVDQILKLDSNENPYGCSIFVQEALASFDRYHFYPDAQATVARERIAATGAPHWREFIEAWDANAADQALKNGTAA